jgi:hypothetical protein
VTLLYKNIIGGTERITGHAQREGEGKIERSSSTWMAAWIVSVALSQKNGSADD